MEVSEGYLVAEGNRYFQDYIKSKFLVMPPPLKIFWSHYTGRAHYGPELTTGEHHFRCPCVTERVKHVSSKNLAIWKQLYKSYYIKELLL